MTKLLEAGAVPDTWAPNGSSVCARIICIFALGSGQPASASLLRCLWSLPDYVQAVHNSRA